MIEIETSHSSSPIRYEQPTKFFGPSGRVRCSHICFVSFVNTAVFKKVATFNIDFASSDGNRTHQNAFRSRDSNFVRKTIEIEWTKNFDSQIEHTLLRSKKSLVMSFHQFER